MVIGELEAIAPIIALDLWQAYCKSCHLMVKFTEGDQAVFLSTVERKFFFETFTSQKPKPKKKKEGFETSATKPSQSRFPCFVIFGCMLNVSPFAVHC